MDNLKLTLAVGDYDHTRDLALGRVRPVGIDLTVLNFNVEEIFFRFYDRLEWEVSEMSMGMYTSALSRGDKRMIAIPVFPSRVFRHSAIYVRSDGPIRTPQDLAGRTVGVPQWSQTATIYVRGYLPQPRRSCRHRVGPGGQRSAGKRPASPAGDFLRRYRRSLSAMLLAGEIDAMISARVPRPVVEGDPRIRRLFPNFRKAEQDYFRDTGIFPIMHTIVIRRDAYDANRWIARNLMLAFEEARDRSVARMLDLTASHVPVPWGMDFAREAGSELVFRDTGYWPYGVAANRTTLEAFLQYAFEQGTCHRRLQIDEVFAEEALAQIKV